VQFKLSAKALSDYGRLIGASISAIQKGFAALSASQRKDIKPDQQLLKLYLAYNDARLAWEAFRDSFRPKEDASTVSASFLRQFAEETKEETGAGATA
jgi:hypothetical protein